MPELTIFGGCLVRWAPDTWAWADHTPAPQVSDLRPSRYYNFRCRTYGSGNSYVEVPCRLANGEPDLSWVSEAGYADGRSGDHTGARVLHSDGRMTRAYADPRTGETTGAKAIPAVYLVPAADWDEWDASTVIGATWPREHEAAIFEKARSLGWEAAV